VIALHSHILAMPSHTRGYRPRSSIFIEWEGRQGCSSGAFHVLLLPWGEGESLVIHEQRGWAGRGARPEEKKALTPDDARRGRGRGGGNIF